MIPSTMSVGDFDYRTTKVKQKGKAYERKSDLRLVT